MTSEHEPEWLPSLPLQAEGDAGSNPVDILRVWIASSFHSSQ
jgi:hypothetical protein